MLVEMKSYREKVEEWKHSIPIAMISKEDEKIVRNSFYRKIHLFRILKLLKNFYPVSLNI